jgi:hypothetical protein
MRRSKFILSRQGAKTRSQKSPSSLGGINVALIDYTMLDIAKAPIPPQRGEEKDKPLIWEGLGWGSYSGKWGTCNKSNPRVNISSMGNISPSVVINLWSLVARIIEPSSKEYSNISCSPR